MLRSLCGVLAGGVATAALIASCSVYDESLLGGGGGDGGAGTGGGTSQGGAPGSTSTGAECETVDDCPGDDSECALRACEDNLCNIVTPPQGTLLSRQTPGDCVELVCDGIGGIATVNADGDVPADDGDECTAAVCVAGAPDHVLVGEGSPCSQGLGVLCTASGECVQCLDDDDCSGTDGCSSGICVAATCNDDILNNGETDIDCGGPVCGATCAIGDDCDGPGDCLGNACNGTCQPSCSDGILNNGETATDCGGPNVCDPCTLGLACNVGNDCDSGSCPDGVCRPALFFSEYVEGSSLNKALEVFNFGNVPVDLAAANCSVLVYNNGGVTPQSTIGLAGTVTEFGVHVLCNNAGVSAACDQNSGALNHNGDDALALVCDGFVLDVIGQIGVDPGVEWGTGLQSTQDNTLRRKGSVVDGDPDGSNAFDPSVEWDGFAIDTLGGLGVHP